MTAGWMILPHHPDPEASRAPFSFGPARFPVLARRIPKRMTADPAERNGERMAPGGYRAAGL